MSPGRFESRPDNSRNRRHSIYADVDFSDELIQQRIDSYTTELLVRHAESRVETRSPRGPEDYTQTDIELLFLTKLIEQSGFINFRDVQDSLMGHNPVKHGNLDVVTHFHNAKENFIKSLDLEVERVT